MSGRTGPRHLLEVSDQVSLIAVTQPRGELRPVNVVVDDGKVGSFLKAVASNDTFRADADIVGE